MRGQTHSGQNQNQNCCSFRTSKPLMASVSLTEYSMKLRLCKNITRVQSNINLLVRRRMEGLKYKFQHLLYTYIMQSRVNVTYCTIMGIRLNGTSGTPLCSKRQGNKPKATKQPAVTIYMFLLLLSTCEAEP